MPGYVITAVFEVDGWLALGRDVLATVWGPGHRFSYCDGRLLTVISDVVADDQGEALDRVVTQTRTACCWLAEAAPTAPVRVRVRALTPREKCVDGAVGRGPDQLFAERAACTTARLRATAAALAELGG